MSTKSIGKVQTYGNLTSYFRKAEPFLFEDEFKNNLFWELAKVSRSRRYPTWAGNVSTRWLAAVMPCDSKVKSVLHICTTKGEATAGNTSGSHV